MPDYLKNTFNSQGLAFWEVNFFKLLNFKKELNTGCYSVWYVCRQRRGEDICPQILCLALFSALACRAFVLSPCLSQLFSHKRPREMNPAFVRRGLMWYWCHRIHYCTSLVPRFALPCPSCVFRTAVSESSTSLHKALPVNQGAEVFRLREQLSETCFCIPSSFWGRWEEWWIVNGYMNCAFRNLGSYLWLCSSVFELEFAYIFTVGVTEQ